MPQHESTFEGPEGLRPLTVCQNIRDEMGELAEDVLCGGGPLESSQLLDHLYQCPGCARTFGGVVQMLTAEHNALLRETITNEALKPKQLSGMLQLWRAHLGLCDEFEDLPGAASALSVLGMIHREQKSYQVAQDLHRLALRTSPGSLLSAMLSETDLGYVALLQSDLQAAHLHLKNALRAAQRLSDVDGQWRVGRLLARTAPGGRNQFVKALAERRYAAAPAGTKALVVNTASEVRVHLEGEPEVDRGGVVHLAIRVDTPTLSELPADFLLEVLFVPSGEVLLAVLVGEAEREQMLAADGLQLQAKLPGHDPSIESLRKYLDDGKLDRCRLPETACVLRIRW